MTTSTTAPDCGLFRKGEHKVEFAYTAHVCCDKNNFVLSCEVTPGNVYDSMVFDTVYEAVTDDFDAVETVAVDAGYKTPWICKKVQGDGRNLSTAYKRPMSEKATACGAQTIERVFADAKEKHGMRYTLHRGLDRVRNWVRLKFAAMNLKKLAMWA